MHVKGWWWVKTWIISDTHLHHNRLTDLCGRPEDFTEQIVRNWSNAVGPNDVVYHLGDVGFYKKREFPGLIRELPGHKILIRGNHDKFPIRWYLENGFMAVMDYAVVNVVYQKGIKKPINTYYKVLLTHVPTVINSSETFLSSSCCNVHGHFHNNPAERWEDYYISIVTPDHLLFSLEEMEYKPVELAAALQHDLLVNTYARLRGEE